MPRITFIDSFGTRYDVEAEPGRSLMHVAVDELIPGIVGDCGGDCSCGTCHAYVQSEYLDRLEAPSPDEAMMLDAVADRTVNSRLSCQIQVGAELDGVEIRVPPSPP